MFDIDKVLARLMDFASLGLLGAFGGMANYVYASLSKQTPFSWKLFVANLFLSLFVGVMLGQFIDDANPVKSGLIMAFGFCAYPILAIIEPWAIEFVRGRLPKKGE